MNLVLKLIKKFINEPIGLVRFIKRLFTRWNPGILDPGGYKLRTKFLYVPLFRFLGALTSHQNPKSYNSFFGEHEFLNLWVNNQGFKFKIVDIGAGDGLTMSNVAESIRINKLEGILIEADGLKFAQLAMNYQKIENVTLIKTLVNLENISGLLNQIRSEKTPYIISLDIDSYDLFLAEKIIKIYPPALLCLEWNPLFHPPYEFTVNTKFSGGWRGDWFWGASIESWNKMLNKNGYGIIKVLGVSFFAEPRKPDCVYLTPEEVFSSYLSQKNRLVIPGETNGVINSLENSKYINIMLDQYSGFYETNFKQ